MASRPLGRLGQWFDSRMPSVAEQWRIHASQYYAPKNFNFWYFFGSLAMLVLAIQIVSGIFLTMAYKPDANLAFGSVEYIMRDVHGGWILRYIHSTGASAFFIVVYLHMFRAMLYGSYKRRASWYGSSACCSTSRSWARRSSATCCRGARCPTGARR